jgi:hypothetical protein
MTQTRTGSALEMAASTGAGFLISFFLTIHLLPWWGFKPTPGEAIEISIIYTIASLLRGYGIRRMFNKYY